MSPMTDAVRRGAGHRLTADAGGVPGGASPRGRCARGDRRDGGGARRRLSRVPAGVHAPATPVRGGPPATSWCSSTPTSRSTPTRWSGSPRRSPRPGPGRACSAPTTTRPRAAGRSPRSATCCTTTSTRARAGRRRRSGRGWARCAGRRSSPAGGFDEQRFPLPSVEDIDLGVRLVARGARIVLDPRDPGHAPQGVDAAVDGVSPTSPGAACRGWRCSCATGERRSTALNLGWRHRLSALGLRQSARWPLLARRPAAAGAALAVLLGLNRDFYRLLARRRGAGEAVLGVGLHVVHHLRRWRRCRSASLATCEIGGTMGEAVRIGLVGAGRLAEDGLPPRAGRRRRGAAGGGRRTGPRPARAGRRRGERAGFASAEQLLLAGGVDALVLATPAAAHLADARLAASAGLPPAGREAAGRRPRRGRRARPARTRPPGSGSTGGSTRASRSCGRRSRGTPRSE